MYMCTLTAILSHNIISSFALSLSSSLRPSFLFLLCRCPPVQSAAAVPHRLHPQKTTKVEVMKVSVVPPLAIPIRTDPWSLRLCPPPPLSPLPPSPLTTHTITDISLTPPHTITSYTVTGRGRHRVSRKKMKMKMMRKRMLERLLLPVARAVAL